MLVVETILSEHIGIRQSEADDQLKKFEILSKTNEVLAKRIGEIQERNTQAKQATQEIDKMLAQCQGVKSEIQGMDMTPERIIEQFNVNQTPAALK